MNQIAIIESKIEVLCKQLDAKERELKAEKLVWAVKEEQMRDNFKRCKDAAEYWKGKYEEVCRCQDCPFCGKRQCMR